MHRVCKFSSVERVPVRAGICACRRFCQNACFFSIAGTVDFLSERALAAYWLEPLKLHERAVGSFLRPLRDIVCTSADACRIAAAADLEVMGMHVDHLLE